MPQHLYAVIVEHAAENCPLIQQSPNAANTLADNLEQAHARGVFSMVLHHGIALVAASSSDGIVDAFAQILPNHKPAVVIDVTGDEWLQKIHDEPERLDEDEALRLELLGHLADRFHGFDLTATADQGLPTNSLRKLPQFLRDNAPTA